MVQPASSRSWTQIASAVLMRDQVLLQTLLPQALRP